MRVAIVGYGKMGKQVEKKLIEKKIDYVTIDKFNDQAKFNLLNQESLNGVDVAIDFSIPESVLENIKQYVSCRTNVVMATTGWYEKKDQVKKMVEDQIGFIWSGNFSLGVNLFFRIIRSSAHLFNAFAGLYEPLLMELHHQNKKDSPSGTALMINDILQSELTHKKSRVTQRLDRKINADEIHVASARGGYFPGTHMVLFDSEVDTIEIKHTARSRDGFAEGACQAAQWIAGKKGFFSIDDFLNSIIK